MSNNNEFGLLLKALREQYGWRHADVAREADIHFKNRKGIEADFANSRLNALENGKKINLNIDEIHALADAFLLTPLEKKEFFLLAMRSNSHTLLGDERNHIEVFNDLQNLLAEIRQPAYVCDAYGDVVLGNLLVAEFLGISMDYINKGRDNPEYYNMLYVIASKESGYSKLFDAHTWQLTLARNIQFIKRISLQHRHKDSFQECLSRLFKTTPLIETYWKKSPNPDVQYSNVERYRHLNSHYGTLEYVATVSPKVTQCGELYLTIYSATNDNAQALITDTYNQLKSQISDMCIYGADWPKPDMFEDTDEN